MYQTPVSDGHNVARARSSVKDGTGAGGVSMGEIGGGMADMEGGAASYAERMDAATARVGPPRGARASRAYMQNYPPPPNMFPVLAGILLAGIVLSLLVQS